MPGRAVWTLIFTLFAARSISIRRDAGVAELLLHELAELDVLVEPLRVVLLLVPLRVPGLDDAEAEADRMDFLSHCASPRSVPLRGPEHDVTWLVFFLIAVRAAHRARHEPAHRRPPVDGERLDEQRVDVDLAALLLGVRDRRAGAASRAARRRLRRELRGGRAPRRPSGRGPRSRRAAPCAARCGGSGARRAARPPGRALRLARAPSSSPTAGASACAAAFSVSVVFFLSAMVFLATSSPPGRAPPRSRPSSRPSGRGRCASARTRRACGRPCSR